MITTVEYFGPHINHPDKTDEVWNNAIDLVDRMNRIYAQAKADGCELPLNPKTGSLISGTTEGGFRPQNSHTGAPNSTHKTGQGIDTYDPSRRFASWCLAHQEALKEEGLYMEDPRWTYAPGKSWVHLQSVPPRSNRRVYIPNANPPLADYPDKF